MLKQKNETITVRGTPITVTSINQEDYISLTDMAKAKGDTGRAADVIKNWIRNRNTLEFLGAWEELYNPSFKVVEFDHFKMQSGLHSFTLPQEERLFRLNHIAITQLTSLLDNEHIKQLKTKDQDFLE